VTEAVITVPAYFNDAHDVETRIGRALISGAVRDGAEIEVDATNGDIAVHYKNAA
jgi:molecular chaperone DnaK (HSP70)